MRDELIKKLFIVISIIVTIILTIGIYKISVNSDHISNIHDIREELTIEDNKLSIKYISGNMIDTEILYGNVYTKIIEIKNKNKIDISYAIKLNESEFSNTMVTFNVYESDSMENNSFNLVTKDAFLNSTDDLGYNFYIAAKSTKYIKIEFKSNYEKDKTTLKGIVKVVANKTEKDIFIAGINRIISELNTRINNLNGINAPGIYILNISELKVENYYGYILVDARDISDLKYYLTIYNNIYAVENLNYNNLNKDFITKYDSNKTSTYNDNSICKLYTKKECLPFSSIQYNETGGRSNFLKQANEIVELVKNGFDKTNKAVYVYSVKEDIKDNSSIEGYILINNTLDNPEYYLYIHNNLFMVSGYNLTKFGEFDANSNTIRAYNKTAFDLTNTKSKVCKFSGFSNCLDKSENVIKK